MKIVLLRLEISHAEKTRYAAESSIKLTCGDGSASSSHVCCRRASVNLIRVAVGANATRPAWSGGIWTNCHFRLRLPHLNILLLRQRCGAIPGGAAKSTVMLRIPVAEVTTTGTA